MCILLTFLGTTLITDQFSCYTYLVKYQEICVFPGSTCTMQIQTRVVLKKKDFVLYELFNNINALCMYEYNNLIMNRKMYEETPDNSLHT